MFFAGVVFFSQLANGEVVWSWGLAVAFVPLTRKRGGCWRMGENGQDCVVTLGGAATVLHVCATLYDSSTVPRFQSCFSACQLENWNCGIKIADL